MKFPRAALFAGITTCALAVSGCAAGASSSSVGELDGSIVYAHSTGPTTLDPAAISSAQELLYLAPVYDRLVYIDPLTRDPSPMLATGWTVGSDATGGYVDFTLQEGLVFPDGTAFTSATVIANIQRSQAATGSVVATDLTQVTGAEAIAPEVVRIRTSGGAAWLPNVFGGPAGMMISENALGNPDLATKPVGIGMWTLESFDPAKVTYTKTDGYWDPSAQQSDELELRFIADDTARFNAIQSGDLDATFIRPSQIASAESAGLDVTETDGATTYTFVMNTATDGLNNDAVRAALQKSVDREGISSALLGGKCVPNNQVFSPGLAWNAPDVEVPKYDPVAAKQEIEAAGYAGMKVTLLTADIDQYKKIAEVIQSNLAEAGVEVEIQVAPASAIRQQFSIDKTADIALTNFGLETDPSQTVARAFLPQGVSNPGGHDDPEINAKAAEALAIADPAARAQAYQEISALAAANGTYLGVCSPKFEWATSGGIDGFDGALAAALPEWRGVKG